MAKTIKWQMHKKNWIHKLKTGIINTGLSKVKEYCKNYTAEKPTLLFKCHNNQTVGSHSPKNQKKRKKAL